MKITMELDNKDFRRSPAIRAFAKLIEELTENEELEHERETKVEVEAEVETEAEHKDESTKENKELSPEESEAVVTKTNKKPKTRRAGKAKAEEPKKLETNTAPAEAVHTEEFREVVQEQEPAPKTEEVPVSAITFEELKTTIMELNRQKSIARDLMSEFNIKCLSDIKPEDYERVINRAKELVA